MGLTLLASSAAPRRPSPSPPPIALVVVVAVDQLRPDYLERYGGQFTGGLRRVLDSGAVFERARQDHAITETAPGHATLLSGRHAGPDGHREQRQGRHRSRRPAARRAGEGASPRRFRGTELYDWMRAADPDARVLSVARKDRTAILMTGRARAPVFWWSGGRFTTSRYYADTLPDWVEAFNAGRPTDRFAGTAWEPLLPPSSYSEPDSVPYEHGGRETAFPHRFPRDPAAVAAGFGDFPWMDSLTLALALDGARVQALGTRGRPDLLLVGLSTTDDIGHAFGPDSREIHDQVLRLDRWLGWFLDSLATQVPRARTLVVLSADHGVQSFPERGGGAGRVWLEDLAVRARAALRRPVKLSFSGGLLTGDTRALRQAGVDIDSLSASLAAAAVRRPGVKRVFTPATLRQARSDDAEARLWRHSLSADVGWLFCAVIEPGYVWSRAEARDAEHGSTAPADVTVPIAFLGPGIRPGRYPRAAATVEIAPTIAALLGVRPLEPLDGGVMPEIVGSAAAQE